MRGGSLRDRAMLPGRPHRRSAYHGPGRRGQAGQGGSDATDVGLRASPAMPHAHVPHPAPKSAPARILVVDDDASIRQAVADILECEGYRVDTATNGQDALEAIARARPAVVLLDMRMPVLDGWGFMRELRARNIRLPVLVVTAARNARDWAEEVGAEGYLAKPFEVADLCDEVERLGGGA